MRVKPFIVGSGMSGKAVAKALAVIDIVDPDITVEAPTQLRRGQPLAGLADGHEQPVLCICNPHGLHARCVTEAQRAGFRAIILDKPPCVNRDELAALRRLAERVRRRSGRGRAARLPADVGAAAACGR